MLDAMRSMDPAVVRGIVHLDERTATDAEIAGLDAAGVRGVRINVSPVRKPEAGLADALRPRIEHLAARLKEVGWHIDFLLPGWLITELMPMLRRLPVRFFGGAYGAVSGGGGAGSGGVPGIFGPGG